MLLAAKSRRRDLDDQMFFPWGDPPRTTPPKAKKSVKRAAPAVEAPKLVPAVPSLEDDLRELCLLLHQLAQKYVPRTNFQDCDVLVQCTRLLQDKHVALPVADDLKAHVDSYNPAVVTRAPQYRLMRNRALAALATVADMANKAPSKGSAEYQRGMRDAFEMASDVAIFFLEDIEAAYEFRR